MSTLTKLLNNASPSAITHAPDNAIFIWVPKNAGTSVLDALKRGAGFSRFKRIKDLRRGFDQCGRVTFGHMDCRSLIRSGYVKQEFYDSAYKFGLVRNPYTRAVSLFLYLKKEGRIKQAVSFLEFCEGLAGGVVEPIGLYNSKGLSQCNPQVTWLKEVDMDYLGRFEELGETFGNIAKVFEMPTVTLPHLNSSDKESVRQFYCERAQDIVEVYYREDFEAFGYDYWSRE